MTLSSCCVQNKEVGMPTSSTSNSDRSRAGIFDRSIKRKLLCLICGLAVVAIIFVASIDRYGLLDILIGAPVAADKRNGGKRPVQELGDDEPCSNQSCLWEREQVLRKHLLWDMCSAFRAEADTYTPRLVYRLSPAAANNLRSKTTTSLSHIFVIDSHKLLYCYIPKVGCTSWKRLFLFLTGKYSSMRDIGQSESHPLMSDTFRNLGSYPTEEAKKLLNSYRKFVIVRNPFERTLSAYQDKFQNDYPSSRVFRKFWSERIIRSVDDSPAKVQHLLETQRRKDGTLNVTFSQFVRFVSAIDGPTARYFMNEHWTQMYGLCHPCLIDYDWIGHYDSLQIDSDSILKAAGIDMRFPKFSTNPTGSSNEDTLLRYYSTLTTSEIETLYQHYALDFSLFGFDIPPSIRDLLNNRGRSGQSAVRELRNVSESNSRF